MLKWTGERYIPEMEPGIIHYEHLHRYKFAKEFVKDKTVLDLGSGEGYGSFLLSATAKEVVGIDINKETITHASSKYLKNNLRFITGSISSIPILEEKIFDVIVCFEAIEHIKEHDSLIKEVKRLLKDDGIFIVSTPNTYVYSGNGPTKNPFHLKEMNYAEFRELLEANFKKVSIYGQKVYPISNIFQISGAGEPLEVTEYCMEKTEKEFSFVDSNKKEALYFVALASNNLIQNPKLGSYLTDVSETVFKQKDSVIKFLENALREKEKIEAGLATELHAKKEEIDGLKKIETGFAKELKN